MTVFVSKGTVAVGGRFVKIVFIFVDNNFHKKYRQLFKNQPIYIKIKQYCDFINFISREIYRLDYGKPINELGEFSRWRQKNKFCSQRINA